MGGESVSKQYYTECKCKDPNYKPGQKTCGLVKYKGDGNCDDQNNNAGCAFDGGDCCGTNVKTLYCKECKCKDPNYKKGQGCGAANYKGDSNCDDENNNAGCAFDGGDCCPETVKGGQVKKQYCKICKCIDPQA